MGSYLLISIAVGVLALAVAGMLSNSISSANAGNDRMKEIAGYIHEGAMAFLAAEYKYLAMFVAFVAVIIGIFLKPLTAVCFVAGAAFSICAGYLGMTVATKANVRTAAAAKDGGMPAALKIAFSGGAVMGLGVVGLGIAGVAAAYMLFGDVEIVTGFGLGASSIALFARVGGGIYTKAADVGADLVGKVEAGIPEDDPRNPAT
ncbi:MAG: sodium/proton-translocating pyrophosphatase, partial [Phascolarctobacterium sp.]|nr:sodium/proton-translocating pyrophosphatase [Phascolarctobacterium sp.]